MQLLSYLNKKPLINNSHFIAAGAKIIGDVTLGGHVNIWFNAVVRADVNKIVIGKNTNIQDLSLLHVTEKDDLIIGDNVTVGHNVILHGCKVGNSSLIGMGAKILDGAIIPPYSLVAAGSVVPPGKTYPSKHMIMGIPAKAVRELTEIEIDSISNHYKSYIEYAGIYQKKA